jgi:hypothetical protein
MLVAVCKRLNHREQFHSVLEGFLAKQTNFPVISCVDTITALRMSNAEFNDQLVQLCCHVWIKLLETNEVPEDSRFEQVFFDPYVKGSVKSFLKELEKALANDTRNVAIWLSIDRALTVCAFEINQLEKLVPTFFRAPCLWFRRFETYVCLCCSKCTRSIQSQMFRMARYSHLSICRASLRF